MICLFEERTMKGKGKGDRGGDLKDCPLQFPDLNPVEHQRVCPTFTTGSVTRPLGGSIRTD